MPTLPILLSGLPKNIPSILCCKNAEAMANHVVWDQYWLEHLTVCLTPNRHRIEFFTKHQILKFHMVSTLLDLIKILLNNP